MTKQTNNVRTVKNDQRMAIKIFHGIFGFYFKQECEEAKAIDKKLTDNPEFIRDILSAIRSLPNPCGKILEERISGIGYKEIAAEYGITPYRVKCYESIAWRKLRHPRSTKLLIKYTHDFNLLMGRYEEEEGK